MSRYISPVLYVLLMLVGCLAFISIAGVRVGLFDPVTGFSLLKKSVISSLVLSLLAVIFLIVCRKECNAASNRFFYLVLVLTILYSAMWIIFYVQRSGLPDINDITTDTVTPPAYININFLRHSGENSLTYHKEWASIQKKFYPNVKPLVTSKSKEVVSQKALKLVLDNDWLLVASYPEVGLIEATARTPVFGFRDDVVIRLMTTRDGKTRVDMRSCSRVGKGDFGVNAKRIVKFMSALSASLNPDQMQRLRFIN